MVVAKGHFLVLLQRAPLDAADGDPAHEVVVVNGADQHLEGGVLIRLRRGNVFEDGLEKGLEVRSLHVGGIGADALPGGAEQHGRIQLLRRGVQIHQQLQNLVDDLVDALIGAVDLIDHHDDPVAQLQRLAQHEAGLGHGTLRRVHQQNDTIDHLQNALHFAAEVSMARGVHNVDFHILIPDRGVLGHNGDAAFPLQIAGVHDPVHGLLSFPVHAALLEHLVYQGGFTVVDVGDDGNVSQVFILHTFSLLLCGSAARACALPLPSSAFLVSSHTV